MDAITQLLLAYGPWGAGAAVVVLGLRWVGKTLSEEIIPGVRAWQERLLTAFEKNTTAFQELRAEMEHRGQLDAARTQAQTAALLGIEERLRKIDDDVSALWGHIGQPRPSRRSGP